jgi:hypothetical protein
MSEDNRSESRADRYIYFFIDNRCYYRLSCEDVDNLVNAALLRLYSDLELGELPVSQPWVDQKSPQFSQGGEPVQTMVDELEKLITNISVGLGLNRNAVRSLSIRLMLELVNNHTQYSL